jgi:MFS family permease
VALRFDQTARAEWRAHWPVVAASALGVGLMSVPSYLNGVFIGPLEKAFGWPRAAISSGFMLNAIAAIVLGPFIGLAVDRYGPRRFALAGSVVVCLAIAGLSAINASLWSWWAVWTVMALGALAIKPMVWTAAVSGLFTASRGLALAVALCGTAIASSATPMICNYVIARYGWRTAYLTLAGLLALVVLPTVFFFFSGAVDKHRAAGARGEAAVEVVFSGVSPREGLTSFRFFRLVLAATTMVLAAVSCQLNLVPILVASGHPRAAAAAIAGAGGLSTILGRLTAGYLIDRINGNVVAGISVAIPVAAFLLLLLAPGVAAAAVAAALILGLSIGAELDTVAYLTTRHFGVRSFGALFGVVGAVLAVAAAGGPMLANYLYDLTHSYVAALWVYIPTSLLGSLLFLTLGRYPVFAPAQAPMSATPAGETPAAA